MFVKARPYLNSVEIYDGAFLQTSLNGFLNAFPVPFDFLFHKLIYLWGISAIKYQIIRNKLINVLLSTEACFSISLLMNDVSQLTNGMDLLILSISVLF